MTKRTVRSQKQHAEEKRARRDFAEDEIARYAWSRDVGAPSDAWLLPWRTGEAPVSLCLAQARAASPAGAPASTKPLVDLLQAIVTAAPLTSVVETYSSARELRVELFANEHISAAVSAWLTTGALCAEAYLAQSSGGGLLYGSLLESTHVRTLIEGTDERLLAARVRDAFGTGGQTASFSKEIEWFRRAWRAGRYRTSYVISKSSTGLL